MIRPLFRMVLATTASLMLCLALVLLLPAPAQAAVNLNTADAAAIAKGLNGIGLKRAQAIVDYRKQHGPFRSVDELALVKGIGPKAIERNRAAIRLEGQSGTRTAAQTPGAGSAKAPTSRR